MQTLLKKYAQLMDDAVPGKSFQIILWDKTHISVGENDAPQFTLRFTTKNSFARTIKDQFLGFGECYMAGEIQVDGDMQLLFRMGMAMGFGDPQLSLMEKIKFAAFALSHRNTPGRSRRNIAHHYDLGNDLYKLYLDTNLVYTCAYFHSFDESLEQAQLNKFEYNCRKLQLKEGESLIDLGCGWGGFMIYAVQNYGVKAVGVTLSQEQYDYNTKLIKKLGLDDRITIHCQDYREAQGCYDKLSSFGLLEHIGKSFIGVKVQKMKELLKPGGLGLLQFAGNDTPYPDDPWTAKYIFPGYHFPVLDHVVREFAVREQNILDIENLRMHYAQTLRYWLERYESNQAKIEAMRGKEFYRCWQLYLSVATASFEFGGNRLFQILFSNGMNNDLPLTREHLYR